MARNDMRQQRSFAELQLLRKGYTPESVKDFLDFWGDPMLARQVLNRHGEPVAYINNENMKVEINAQIREEISEKLRARPRLARESLYAPPGGQA